MASYLRAELYKAFRRKYVYLFALVMLLCEGLLVGGWAFTNANGNHIGFSAGVGMIGSLLTVGLYSTILIADIVFSEQYKFGTLKNEVSYGLPRSRIFLGKLIVECVVALVLCALFVAAYVGMCYVALPHDPAADAQAMAQLGYMLLASLPLWLGAQGFIHMIFFLLKSTNVGSFLAVGIFIGAGQIFRLMSMLMDGGIGRVFYGLYRVLLTTPFDLMGNFLGDGAFLGQAAAIGMGWFLLSAAVGLAAWRRKEIN